jgi:SAM-dependent methyltransferase
MKSKKQDIFRKSRGIFESYKDTYRQEIQKSIDFVGQDLEFFTEVKVSSLLSLTRQFIGNPSNLNILDVGCGVGITDYYLTSKFKKVYGIDLSRGVVNKAAALNPKVSYKFYGGEKLPYPDNSMDVTFAICVMHHVVQEGMFEFGKEMLRVTKKGGLAVVFEHNPFNPLTRYAVSHCDLDKDAHLLSLKQVKEILLNAEGAIVDSRYILFTPFRGKGFSYLDAALNWLPLGAQYLVAARK